MLVLTRRHMESVIITVGDVRIKVTFIEMREKKARLGFEAPQHVTVHREEIQEEIDNERKER